MVKCDGCGLEEEIVMENISDYEDNGYGILWDITCGLTDIIFCKTCKSKLKRNIEEIEKIIKKNIDDVNFTGF